MSNRVTAVSAPFEFEKYEGLGNDFVVLDAPGPLEPGDVIALCDRHLGVGADGVLVVAEPKTPGSRARMIVQNADGSRPEMCGNGLRCVALRLAEREGREHAEYSIDTDSGPRLCEVTRTNGSASVLIDMGKAESRGVHRAEFDGAERTFDLVSIGNPHAVALDFLPSLEKIDRFAPMVSATLPGGVNIEFVHEQSEGVFRVVVWERGVGRTQACGTGAAAVASVLARLGRIGYGAPAQVELPGGRLELSVAPGSLDVRLRGPARRVFGGALPAPPVGAREST